MKGERKYQNIQDLYEAIQAAEVLNLDYKVLRSCEKRRSFYLVEKEVPCWRFIIIAEMFSEILMDSLGQPGEKDEKGESA